MKGQKRKRPSTRGGVSTRARKTVSDENEPTRQPPHTLEFYIKSTEFTKTCKIQTKCFVKNTVDVIKKLKEEVSWFTSHPQFRHFSHMPDEKYRKLQGMWMLLLRTICTEEEDVAWFAVNDSPCEDCPRMCKSRFTNSSMRGYPLEDIYAALGKTKVKNSVLVPTTSEETLLACIIDEEQEYHQERQSEGEVSRRIILNSGLEQSLKGLEDRIVKAMGEGFDRLTAMVEAKLEWDAGRDYGKDDGRDYGKEVGEKGKENSETGEKVENSETGAKVENREDDEKLEEDVEEEEQEAEEVKENSENNEEEKENSENYEKEDDEEMENSEYDEQEAERRRVEADAAWRIILSESDNDEDVEKKKKKKEAENAEKLEKEAEKESEGTFTPLRGRITPSAVEAEKAVETEEKNNEEEAMVTEKEAIETEKEAE
ncbi:uncharacterized protein At3g43530-like [Brassica napus]|uniref:uncharacterized protein At3g43530-like n=1 Tax=Brassica napus TaxID=3708 RepID=UPI0006AB5C5A|nr:uncharacterized protein At3g43530-like [Brassica napus]